MDSKIYNLYYTPSFHKRDIKLARLINHSSEHYQDLDTGCIVLKANCFETYEELEGYIYL